MTRSKDGFVVLDGLLYYVDPARKERAWLVLPVALRYKLVDEVHCGGFL